MADVKDLGNQDNPNFAEILIVIEDSSIHDSIFDSIKSTGIAVNIIRDACLLPQKLATRKPDFIFLDFCLPLMDGIEVCRQLKTSNHTRDIPVALMFARDDLDNRAQGFQAGAVDYLLKPLVLEEFTAKLSLHVRQPTVALQFASSLIQSGKREPQSRDNSEGLCLEPSCEVCTELSLQKRYFRDIFHNLSDNIYLLEVTEDGCFRYLETNRAYEASAGVPEDGLRGRYFGDLLRPLEDKATVEKAIAKFRRCLDTGSIIDEEITLELKSGRRIFRSTLTPLFDDSGRINRILVNSHDITESKQAERQIGFMNFALDQAHDAVFLVDPQADFRFRYVNDKACQSLGYSREELLSMTVPDIDPFVDLEAARNIDEQIHKQDFARMETVHRAKDGHLIPVEISGTEFEYEGQMMGLSISRDISERKRVEFDRKLLTDILEESPDFVGTTDLQGKLCYHNRTARLMVGLPVDVDVTNMHITDMHPEWATKLIIDTALPTVLEQGIWRGESALLHRDGREISVQQTIMLHRGANGKPMSTSTIMQDITERKRMEAEAQNHLHFFESMDRINRAIQSSNDLETVMNDLLSEVLAIFDCDRAFLVYPCDPEADSWSVPLERTRPEYPGALALGLVIPMDAGIATAFRILLDADGPVAYGPGNQHPLPEEMSAQFHFKSKMSLAVHPKSDKPWQFGIHQCSRAMAWTADEQKLFQEIGRRLADGLSSLLAYRTLQASEREYRALAENLSLGIARYDMEGRITYFNPSLETLLGITTAEARGQKPTECFPGGFYDNYEKKLLQVSASGEPLEFELQLPGEDGLEVGRITMVAERDTAGNVNGVLAIGQNFTAQRRAESALQRSEALYRSMVVAMIEGVIVQSKDGNIISINPAAEKILNLSADKVLGTSLLNGVQQAFTKDGKPFPDDQYPARVSLRTGQPQSGVEIGLYRYDGEVVWILVNSQPLFIEEEIKPYAVVSTFHDITERKRMEATIRKREEEFRTLTENLPDIIIRYDLSLRRIYINKVYSKMLESIDVDILGKTPLECWRAIEPNADQFTRLLQQVVETGNPETTMIQAETRAGKFIHWTMNLVPEFDQEGVVTGVLSCATDITELKEYERKVEESRMQLRALATRSEKLREDERKRLARDLHDDLGQRLTALKLDLARLMLRFGQNNPELGRQIQEMDLNMGATIQIVRDVATQLRPNALEMGIVSGLEWLIMEFRKRSNVKCRLRIPKDKLTLDDHQDTALFHIVQESLTNIMRHAMATEVKIVLSCVSKHYVLEISDNGVGFDSKKRKTGSFGLIGIEERALSLGGDMHIETALNHGLKLTIRIPVFHVIGEVL